MKPCPGVYALTSATKDAQGAASSAGGTHVLMSVSWPVWIRSSIRSSPVVEKQLVLPSQPRSPAKFLGSAFKLFLLIDRGATPKSFGASPRRFGFFANLAYSAIALSKAVAGWAAVSVAKIPNYSRARLNDKKKKERKKKTRQDSVR